MVALFPKTPMTLKEVVKAQPESGPKLFANESAALWLPNPTSVLKNICQRNRELVYQSWFDGNTIYFLYSLVYIDFWRRAIALEYRKDGQYHGEDEGVCERLKLLTFTCADIIYRIEAEMARTQSMYMNLEIMIRLG